MKISILTPNLSSNCLGRSYLLAKILQRHYEIEMVGPIFSNDIWGPLKNDRGLKYKTVKFSGKFQPYWQIKKMISLISGDIIYASKPFFTSLGVGLLKKTLKKIPIILDIDDWEMGFIKEKMKNMSKINKLKYITTSSIFLYEQNSYWNNIISDKLIKFADDITVSNTFLQKKYGGTIIWHGRDHKDFDPVKFNKIKIRKKYNINDDKKIIMFFGTPRPHKGVENLLSAIKLINDDKVLLVIVGIDNKPYSQQILKDAKKFLNNRFRGFGMQPFEKIPEFLAMADIAVVPQRKNYASLGQLPAKIFDAMSMAKPIIATNVSDLAQIMKGCGWMVEPENPKQLAEKILYILNNYLEAEKNGEKARKKLIAEYSWDALDKKLASVFQKYE